MHLDRDRSQDGSLQVVPTIVKGQVRQKDESLLVRPPRQIEDFHGLTLDRVPFAQDIVVEAQYQHLRVERQVERIA